MHLQQVASVATLSVLHCFLNVKKLRLRFSLPEFFCALALRSYGVRNTR